MRALSSRGCCCCCIDPLSHSLSPIISRRAGLGGTAGGRDRSAARPHTGTFPRLVVRPVPAPPATASESGRSTVAAPGYASRWIDGLIDACLTGPYSHAQRLRKCRRDAAMHGSLAHCCWLTCRELSLRSGQLLGEMTMPACRTVNSSTRTRSCPGRKGRATFIVRSTSS
jgi:hypothetical protein